MDVSDLSLFATSFLLSPNIPLNTILKRKAHFKIKIYDYFSVLK
jgi:hypothetical protein